MTEQEISKFLDPHEQILRAIRNGAGDREILEAKDSIRTIVDRFRFAPVRGLAQTAFIYLDDALRYKDFQKKNEAAVKGAEYFADRVFKVIWEVEMAKSV